ncbi:MAG TPA: AraC family transcriptional regulator, partial [Acidobacteriaceae bacterium]
MSTMPVSSKISNSNIPTLPPDDAIAPKIAQVTRLLDAGEGDLSLTALAESVQLSPFTLQRAFKRILGVSP